MHFFECFFETLAASVIHRKEGECLRERHTIHTPVQKLDVCIHFPKSCTEHYFPKCSLRNGTLHKQSRSPCQREPLQHSNELLVIDRENRFLLMRHTDSRWSVFVRFPVWRHCRQDDKQAQSGQCYIGVPPRIDFGFAGCLGLLEHSRRHLDDRAIKVVHVGGFLFYLWKEDESFSDLLSSFALPHTGREVTRLPQSEPGRRSPVAFSGRYPNRHSLFGWETGRRKLAVCFHDRRPRHTNLTDSTRLVG